MKYFLSRVRPYVGMLITDFILLAFWVFCMKYSFDQMSASWLRIMHKVILTVALIATIIIRYHSIYRRYGVDDVTGGKVKKEFERIANGLMKKKGSYVVVYANINRFKLLNDMYGIAVGDEILRTVHSIIDEELNWDEVSGRTMADNYGILMHFNSIKTLEERLYRITRKIRDIRDEDNESYGVTMTYGIYIAKDNELSMDSMLEKAHLAGINVSTAYLVPLGIYDDGARQKLGRERELELKMQKALDCKEFQPFLQPKYDLKNEKISGAEALVRWIDPSEGMIFPNEFIPLFESNGFIVKIDLYMFEEVCKLIERWDMAGFKVLPISVNLSRANFGIANFFDNYRKIIEKYHIPKGSIEFEFTESLLFDNLDDLNDLVTQIHELGFYCSIDDFGSGYSSLNVLKDVRVDVLKLDQVFFREGDDSQRAKDVIRSVIGLARALHLKTVSEGIEFREQVDFLKEMECDYVQGYIFARPMTVTAYERLVYLQE